jgi:hypothetical protein
MYLMDLHLRLTGFDRQFLVQAVSTCEVALHVQVNALVLSGAYHVILCWVGKRDTLQKL